MSAERGHERGAEGEYTHTHTYNTGALNFNLTAADLELDADEAKAVLTVSLKAAGGGERSLYQADTVYSLNSALTAPS